MRRALVGVLPVACLLVLMVGGCGGGSERGAAGGAVQFTIQWPQESRIIPAATQSIAILLSVPETTSQVRRAARQALTGTPIAVRIVPRPPEGQGTTVVRFDNLPPGPLLAIATAWPSSNGTGTPQARGSVLLWIESLKTTSAMLTMNSTVATVGVSPTGPLALYVGDSADLTSTAYDAAGAIVLCADSAWAWAVDDPGVATVAAHSPTATVTGAGDGTATVTVTQQESGQTAEVPVTVVTRAANLVVSPTGLDFGATDTEKTFAVSNTGTAALTWSCSVPGGAGWVTGLSPARGALQPGASVTVTVTVSRLGLTGGAYSAACVVLDEVGGGARIVDLLMAVPNAAPVIESLTANPQDVGPRGTSTITCVASDADGDPLIYGWLAPGGTLSGVGPSVTWTAPATAGVYDISCLVDDGRGGMTFATASVYVSDTEIVIQ